MNSEGPRYHAPITDASDSKNQLGPPAEGAVSRLRGAPVAVDPQRAAQVILALVMVVLAVAAALLFVAGAHKNGQIHSLKTDGDRVSVRVATCLGQLGGSGSNLAGYSCTGTFTYGGHNYTVDIPGNVRRAPGSHVECVVDRSDPTLIDTASDVAAEGESFGVYLAPIVITVALVVLETVVLLGRRRRRRRVS